MKRITVNKKNYEPLSVKIWEVAQQNSVICTSGGRNDYEEENW